MLSRSARWLPAILGIVLVGGCSLFEAGPSVTTIPGQPHRTHALAPRGKQGSEVTLALQGQSWCEIQLPEKPTAQEQRAADELAKWLGEMTGAKIATTRAPSAALMAEVKALNKRAITTNAPHVNEISVSPDKSFVDDLIPLDQEGRTCVIHIGATRSQSQLKLPHASADLGDEGYAIDVIDGNIYLNGGRRRGPLNAVYALLEEDLGCRWYARGTSNIPRVPELRFRPVPRHFVPRLMVRDPYYWDAFDRNWSLRNRTSSSMSVIPADLGGDATAAGGYFVHTFDRMVPAAKYFKDHPEYFSMNKGVRTQRQLCMTHPEVLRLTIADVRRVLDADPTAKIISVSPNDDRGFCECADCKAIWDREGTPAGPLLTFVNAVADAIAFDHPNVRVSTLAYFDTYKAPATLRPRKNVIIQLCTDRHSWSEPFLPVTETENFQSAMKAWHKLGAAMHIWDYTVNYGHYSILMPNLPIVTDDIRFYIEHGAEGVMLQGSYQSPGGADAPLKSWVWAKQLWDPSRDTRALIRDFIEGYYGPAAPAMQAYQDQLWALWKAEHHRGLKKPPDGIRYVPTLPVFDDAFMAQAWGHLDEAARQAAGDSEIQRRVEMATVPVMYSDLAGECKRILTLGQPRNEPRYMAMIARLESVAKREQITHFSEGDNDADRFIKRLRTVGSKEGMKPQEWKATTAQGEARVFKLPTFWSFARDPLNVGVAERWFIVDCAGAEWVSMRSDLDWGWEHQGHSGYTGYGWYRMTITPPADWKATHQYLYFGAVDEDAWVYINGDLALDHSCEATGLRPEQIWTTPFMLDAAKWIKPGQANTIAVRVNNRAGMGGVWRPAYLVGSDAPLALAAVQAAVAKK